MVVGFEEGSGISGGCYKLFSLIFQKIEDPWLHFEKTINFMKRVISIADATEINADRFSSNSKKKRSAIILLSSCVEKFQQWQNTPKENLAGALNCLQFRYYLSR